jgi:hypothetical protein
MKVIKAAAQGIIDELTKSKVVVTFSGKIHYGYPTWSPYDDTYEMEEVDPKETGGLIVKEFIPFSLSINNEFVSPLKFPFNTDPRYNQHMENLRNQVISEIDSNINLRIGKWDILDYLTNLEFELKEIKNNFKKQELEVLDDTGNSIKVDRHIEMNDFPIFNNLNIKLDVQGITDVSPYEGLYMYYSLSRYWDIQITIIERLLRIIDTRKAIIEKTDDYVKEINSLPSQSSFQWTKTDTDLLELIIALYEVGAIQNATKDLTQKEAIQSFSDFFGKEIKDQYKKLNAARYRKKEDPGFISKLQKALESYYQNLNEKN